MKIDMPALQYGPQIHAVRQFAGDDNCYEVIQRHTLMRLGLRGFLRLFFGIDNERYTKIGRKVGEALGELKRLGIVKEYSMSDEEPRTVTVQVHAPDQMRVVVEEVNVTLRPYSGLLRYLMGALRRY